MSKTTANFGLIKPELTDAADITNTNQNWDIVDEQLKNTKDRLDNLSTDAGNLTGVLPVKHGGTGANTASDALSKLGAAASDHTHKYAGSSTAGGSATSAEKLATERTIRTNLGSTSTASFDGTKNVTPGVTGVLPVTNGGTGANSVESVQSKFGIVPMNDIPNLHIWGKYTGNPSGYSLGTSKTAIVGWSAASTSASVSYSDTIEIVDGKAKLVNSTSVAGVNASDFDVIKGKFVNYGLFGSEVYLVSSTATLEFVGNSGIRASSAQQVIVNSSGPLGYVASKENNTYPTNGQHSDGYWYVYSKQLGATEDTDYDYGTTDLTPGTTALETGKLYFVYE